MNKRFLLFCLAILILAFGISAGFSQTRYFVGGGVQSAFPMKNLDSRFMPTTFPTIRFGWKDTEKGKTLFEFAPMTFSKINTEKMYYDSVDQYLKIQSAAAGYQQTIFTVFKKIDVAVTGAVTLNKWLYRREPFYCRDTNASIIDTLLEFKQSDWSWGAKAGAVVTFSPVSWIHLGVSAQFHLIIAELWPAMAVRMENVSGLKLSEVCAFIEFSREF
ncbi:MAG: hypothetical protein COT43_06655 [Candidatus Marinimicrobia bacterium CG08_land_8_20_14_0_20_45_22]|nr:MAG: hypothetical protein COT43_06655 [Candidatus Marinimicrobia bacterium CG08_land_8_20_14_0_20_45_22]